MLSLSTSFLSTQVEEGRQLLESLERCNIQGDELDCRLNRDQFEQIKAHIGASRLRVGSLHNYCPFPAVKPQIPPGGDYFRLSAPDAEERESAVQWTIRTIEHANSLEADAVVLHCGAVEMKARCADLYRMFNQGRGATEAFRDLISKELEIREQLKFPCLDALLFSLERS